MKDNKSYSLMDVLSQEVSISGWEPLGKFLWQQHWHSTHLRRCPSWPHIPPLYVAVPQTVVACCPYLHWLVSGHNLLDQIITWTGGDNLLSQQKPSGSSSNLRLESQTKLLVGPRTRIKVQGPSRTTLTSSHGFTLQYFLVFYKLLEDVCLDLIYVYLSYSERNYWHLKQHGFDR